MTRKREKTDIGKVGHQRTVAQLAALAPYVRLIYLQSRAILAWKRHAYQASMGSRRVRQTGWQDMRPARYEKNDPVWVRMVRFCIKHEVDALDFVASQFRGLDALKRALQPHQLLTAAAVKRWRKVRLLDERVISLQATLNQSALHNCARAYLIEHCFYGGEPATADIALRCAVRRSDRGVSPLYGYCAAVKSGHDVIAEQLFADAAMQYVAHRGVYQEVWKAVIPADFDVRALSFWADTIEAWEAHHQPRHKPITMPQTPTAGTHEKEEFQW